MAFFKKEVDKYALNQEAYDSLYDEYVESMYNKNNKFVTTDKDYEDYREQVPKVGVNEALKTIFSDRLIEPKNMQGTIQYNVEKAKEEPKVEPTIDFSKEVVTNFQNIPVTNPIEFKIDSKEEFTDVVKEVSEDNLENDDKLLVKAVGDSTNEPTVAEDVVEEHAKIEDAVKEDVINPVTKEVAPEEPVEPKEDVEEAPILNKEAVLEDTNLVKEDAMVEPTVDISNIEVKEPELVKQEDVEQYVPVQSGDSKTIADLEKIDFSQPLKYKKTQDSRRQTRLEGFVTKDYVVAKLNKLNIKVAIRDNGVDFYFRQHHLIVSPLYFKFVNNGFMRAFYQTHTNAHKEFETNLNNLRKSYKKFDVELEYIYRLVITAYNTRIVNEDKYLK